MSRSLTMLLVTVVAGFALAGCGRPPAEPVAALPAPEERAQAPSTPATPPPPPDVLTTAPAGTGGIPVPVQKEVDRFEGRHVSLKVADAPFLRDAPRKIHTFTDAEKGSEYTFDGLGVLIGHFHGGPPGPAPNVGDSPLSDAELTAKARAYVREHFDERQAAWPARVERRVAGIDQNGKKNYEFSVELRERVGDVPSPNYIRFVVDKQGSVLSFNREYGAVSVAGTKPKVTRERAVSIVAAKAGYAGPKVTKAELSVVRDARGGTFLAWTIELDPPPTPTNVMMVGGHIWATVDAVSGVILTFGTS